MILKSGVVVLVFLISGLPHGKAEDLAASITKGLKHDKRTFTAKLQGVSDQDEEAYVLRSYLLHQFVCQIKSSFAEKKCQELRDSPEFALRHPPLNSLRDFPFNEKNKTLVIRSLAGAFEGMALTFPPEQAHLAQTVVTEAGSVLARTLELEALTFRLQSLDKLLGDAMFNHSLAAYVPVIKEMTDWLVNQPKLTTQPPAIYLPYKVVGSSASKQAFCGISNDKTRVACWSSDSRTSKIVTPQNLNIMEIREVSVDDQGATFCVIGKTLSEKEIEQKEKMVCFDQEKILFEINHTHPEFKRGLAVFKPSGLKHDWKKIHCFQVPYPEKLFNFCIDLDGEPSWFWDPHESERKNRPVDPNLKSVEYIHSENLWCWPGEGKIVCANNTAPRNNTRYFKHSEGATGMFVNRDYFCGRKPGLWFCYTQYGDNYQEIQTDAETPSEDLTFFRGESFYKEEGLCFHGRRETKCLVGGKVFYIPGLKGQATLDNHLFCIRTESGSKAKGSVTCEDENGRRWTPFSGAELEDIPHSAWLVSDEHRVCMNTGEYGPSLCKLRPGISRKTAAEFYPNGLNQNAPHRTYTGSFYPDYRCSDRGYSSVLECFSSKDNKPRDQSVPLISIRKGDGEITWRARNLACWKDAYNAYCLRFDSQGVPEILRW